MDKHGNNITENLTDQNDPERSEKQVKLKITQRPMFRRGLFIFLVLASVFTFAIAVFRIGDIFAVLDSIFGYIMPVFYGIAIAYLLNPVVNFFQLRFEPFLKKRCRSETRAKKLSKALSIALSVIFGISVIIVLCVMILPELLYSLSTLASILPDELTKVIDFLQNGIDTEQYWGETLKTFIDTAFNALEKWLSDGLPELVNTAITYLTDSVISIVGFLVNFFIGIVVSVYVLFDKDKFRGQAKKMLFAFLKPKNANIVIDTVRHGHEIFGGFLTSKLIDALIVGVITALFMLITGMPYVVLISVLIGVTNVIPFFGPFIGGIPSALLLLLMDPMDGLVFIIFIIILQQIDGNIIEPKILGSTTGISEFWVTFALLFFGGIFGFLGMIIGVPIFAVIYYLIRLWINEHLKNKDLPLSSEEYKNIQKYDTENERFVMLPENHLQERIRIKKDNAKGFWFWRKFIGSSKRRSAGTGEKDKTAGPAPNDPEDTERSAGAGEDKPSDGNGQTG